MRGAILFNGTSVGPKHIALPHGGDVVQLRWCCVGGVSETTETRSRKQVETRISTEKFIYTLVPFGFGSKAPPVMGPSFRLQTFFHTDSPRPSSTANPFVRPLDSGLRSSLFRRSRPSLAPPGLFWGGPPRSYPQISLLQVSH